MSEPSVLISHRAYKKIILHSAKHPSSTVSGLIVASPSSSTPGNELPSFEVTDVIPLFHHWNSLSPMAEVALALASSHVKSLSKTIVGIYEAPKLVSEKTPSPQSTRIAQRIASLSPDRQHTAIVLVVNNSLLLTPNSHSLLPFTVTESGTGQEVGKGSSNPVVKPLPSNLIKPKTMRSGAIQLERGTEQSVQQVETAVKSGEWKDLVDFDDHLEDLKADWLANPSIKV
ncbi:UPF0172-domain-containing protein [Violaceomyces palustris]|uniref:UPF0172-domain-containing protein n=1 Tax=Violaceomyces palustris TaxID=1673888 RepID=A0ACD0NW52_9BASI|nr:UPF0172-domain-containing protein [Violaceomyces palustris]